MHHGTWRPRRRGFSVLELTIAIAILGIMMAVAGFAFVPMLLNARKKATEATMQTVGQALKQHWADKGGYPQDLRGLVPNYLETYPLDGWDQEFYYSPSGASPNTFLLISWGNDKIDGTEDDINYEDVIDRERNRDLNNQ